MNGMKGLKGIKHTLSRTSTFFTLLLAAASPAWGDQLCGDDGVWVQVLGAGGPEIDDRQGGASYLLWHDGRARLLVDTGPGASVAFDVAEADFTDLVAVAFTHLHADHTADFPAFIEGSRYLDRTEPLIVLGPDSNTPDYPDTEAFVNRLIGPEGAFPYLRDFLTYKSSGGYRVRARNVPSTGKRRWARFNHDELRLAAIPVNHGAVPALAWRAEIGGKAVVFTGDFNNQKNVIPEFAKNVDALVVSHSIPENARGAQRDLHVLPSQIGRIATQANARMVMLTHRMSRTRGKESLSRGHMEKNYDGYIIFTNDMECWGL